MAQLSLTGLIVALDAFGPNHRQRGGIAEMADLPQDVSRHHRPARRGPEYDQGGHQGLCDRLGALAALVLFRRLHAPSSRRRPAHVLSFQISDPPVLIGLLIGGIMVYLFAPSGD